MINRVFFHQVNIAKVYFLYEQINPGDVGMSLSEFMLSENVNQYVLAEMFDVSRERSKRC